jgi:hypothetical protein
MMRTLNDKKNNKRRFKTDHHTSKTALAPSNLGFGKYNHIDRQVL